MSPISGPWGAENGEGDGVFVARLRELLDDMPVLADEQFNGNGTSTKFQCQRLKINDDNYLGVTVGGVAQTIVGLRSSAQGSTVWIDYETGLMIFGVAPGSGNNNVIITKTRVRWRDSVLVAALYGGLRSLYPGMFKFGVDTSIKMVTNQWDYTLPQDFWDPRVKITKIAMQDVPASVNPFKEIAGAKRVGLDTIHIPFSQAWPPNAVMRLEYAAPYRTLSELEWQAQDLPLWYAAAQLLGFGEAKRTRQENATVSSDTSANQPGYQQNAGAWYMAQYKALKQNLQQPMPMARMTTTYMR